MTIEDLKIEDAVVEDIKAERAQENPEDLLKKVKFKPSVLIWENFHAKQPEPNRWIYLWCGLGSISQNIFLTYRDSLGQYDLPHPTKKYPAHAWAYAENPVVQEESDETN